NEQSVTAGLPVGFVVANDSSGESIGMTCSARPTPQNEGSGAALRIHGRAALAEFPGFLPDLHQAARPAIIGHHAVQDLAVAVRGASPPPDKVSALRDEVQAWYQPYHTLMDRALPPQAWGPSRLDAISMIFNRVTGLDIGQPPTFMIPGNIRRADAPAR